VTSVPQFGLKEKQVPGGGFANNLPRNFAEKVSTARS